MEIKKYNGLYVGTVIDNKDPKRIGRYKVKIPSITGNIKKEDLPWAKCCFEFGGYADMGKFELLEIGSIVIVGFIEGSIYQPVIFGTYYRDILPPKEFINRESGYVKRKGTKTKSSLVVYDDEHDYTIIKNLKSGNYILFTGKGKIEIINDIGCSSIIMESNGDIYMDGNKFYWNKGKEFTDLSYLDLEPDIPEDKSTWGAK